MIEGLGPAAGKAIGGSLATVAAVGGYAAAALAEGNLPATASALVVMLTFSGVLLRQFFASQRELRRSLEDRQNALEDERDQHDFTRWELATARAQLYGHEGPGPFVPRRRNP